MNPPFKLPWKTFLIIIAVAVVVVISLSVGLAVGLRNAAAASSSSNSIGNPNAPIDTTDPTTVSAYQYTPDQSDWDLMNAKTLNVSTVDDHSPDGVRWVTSWPTWNGSIFNLTGMSNAQVQSNLCVGGIVRGTRALYYEKPFANPKAPTKAEVDDLHIRTIRHLRRMVGIDSIVSVTFDRCLCSIALWSQQVYATTIWDEKYPTAKNTSCFIGGHCDFAPNATDQVQTFDGKRHNITCTTGMTSAEGIGSTNADLPWSLKFHRTICQFLSEGTTGHPGPLFRRTKICPIFYYGGSGNGATIRIKSGGNVFNTLYFD